MAGSPKKRARREAAERARREAESAARNPQTTQRPASRPVPAKKPSHAYDDLPAYVLKDLPPARPPSTKTMAKMVTHDNYVQIAEKNLHVEANKFRFEFFVDELAYKMYSKTFVSDATAEMKKRIGKPLSDKESDVKRELAKERAFRAQRWKWKPSEGTRPHRLKRWLLRLPKRIIRRIALRITMKLRDW